jgi:outer membrane protein OmpA-like peptidoglycan-associated protein
MRLASAWSVVSFTLLGSLPQAVSAAEDEASDATQGVAAAAPAEGSPASASGAVSTPASRGGLSKRTDRPWIQRWAPERNMAEIGVYGGIFLPARDIELFEPNLNLPRQGFKRFRPVGPEVGARIGYYPLRHFGIEAEGGWSPTRLVDDGQPVNLWTVRGHLVGQLGWWSVTPFALVGAGAIAASSAASAVGTDIDPALHFGLGAKFFIHRYVSARIEARDVVTPRRGVEAGATNNLEVLAGLSITLGRERDRDDRRPSDRDHDGFPDDRDQCPDVPGVAPDGCPLLDSDGDGFLDVDDQCPDVPGVAPDGCPPPDSDGDGFLDPDDQCPNEPGVAPDGCPDLDADKDGIPIPQDQCPDEPETFNGFEDEDGCPDEVPPDLAGFSGTIEGVFFDVGKATLKPESRKTLDGAVDVLTRYPKVRVEISGHTDSTGARDLNMDLSRRRADAVMEYLVSKGIDASRLQTRGAGPDEPIDTNQTKPGRARNRRIEFRQL